MIPKKIHLWWFSGDKYPEDIKFCLDSWGKILPDFEIKVWTKEMAIATGYDYVREAISVKKWAFAADVIRLYAVYQEGGVYMDSDIFVQQRFDAFLKKKCVFFQEYHPSVFTSNDVDESGNRHKSIDCVTGMGIQAALFMSEPKHPFIRALLEYYQGKHFVLEDGTYNMSLLAPAVYALSAEKYGYRYINIGQRLTCDVDVFPSDYVASDIPYRKKAAFAVHCASHSWHDEFQNNLRRKDPLLIRVKVFMYNLYCRLTGKPYHKELKTIKEKLKAYPV